MIKDAIEITIKARIPLIYIVSWEEERVKVMLEKIAIKEKKKFYTWTITNGLENIAFGKVEPTTKDPVNVISEIIKLDEKAIYLLMDYHPYMGEPRVVRRLRDAVKALYQSNKTIIILSPILKVPEELEKEIKVFDFDLPTIAELGEVLDSLKEKYDKAIKLNESERERLLNTARGLTLKEMENVLSEAIIRDGKIDKDTISVMLDEKKQIIRKTEMLEYFSPETDLNDVGGLDILKNWLSKRVYAFSAKARAFGIPEPKGILLVGVQGCGKSLVAKSVARVWKLPLLRLDMGRLFAGIVGSSEANVRRAIKLAESLAPAILWIDEIEKGFSGVHSSGYSDAGTTARVYGSFITWLQEKKAPVFVIATANLVELLPPELLRKGRFDEIFFVDLPNVKERIEIFRIHLSKLNRDPKKFDLEGLAFISEGYSGAEIEQAIISALYDAFIFDRPLTSEDIERSIKESIPLSSMMAEQINQLREWAKQRTRPASST